MHQIIRNLALGLAMLMLLTLSGCSLLKLQADFGTEPLSSKQLNTRMAVRSYYKAFIGQVVQTADSIIANTDDLHIKSEAIKWKIGATSACAQTAFQSDAEIALVDTWLLTRQMHAFFNESGSEALADYTTWARDCAAELYQQIDATAKNSNPTKHYHKLASFVETYPLESELTGWTFTRNNTRPALIAFLEVPDSLYTTTIGSSAEVMNDFTDRISAYNDQIKSQLSWEKDLIVLALDNDSIAEPYLARIDSLSTMLNRLTIVAKESPEMLGVIAVKMREELSPIVYDFNSGMRSSLGQLAHERQQLQSYLNEQRILLKDDLQDSGQVLIKETTDNLIRFVQRVSWLIIILVVVLAAVFFGVPFAAGYYLAKARFKRTAKKE